MSLVTVGSVAFDAIETPYGKTDKIIGGAGTYIAIASSYFTKKQNIVAVVGEDFPQSMIDKLGDRGVNLDGLQIKKGKKSFFWSGKYSQNMNNRESLITELNVLGEFDPVIPDTYQDCDYLTLGNLSPDVQLKVIERLNNRPKLIALDTMNFWMDVAMDDLTKVLQRVDLLIINDEEARQLSGEYSLSVAARKIRAMGPKYLIIKKGEHGALLFYEDQLFFTPALLLDKVFDPTGAGDTFAGGLMGYLAATNDISFENMKRGVVVGSAIASFCVEKFGTERIENLSKEEIIDRIEQFADLTNFEMQEIRLSTVN